MPVPPTDVVRINRTSTRESLSSARHMVGNSARGAILCKQCHRLLHHTDMPLKWERYWDTQRFSLTSPREIVAELGLESENPNFHDSSTLAASPDPPPTDCFGLAKHLWVAGCPRTVVWLAEFHTGRWVSSAGSCPDSAGKVQARGGWAAPALAAGQRLCVCGRS